jgi:hypothetical protein
MTQGLVIKDDFPPGFHEAFGRMVMWFGRIEYLMKLARLRLGGTPSGQGLLDPETGTHFETQRRELQALYDARFADPVQRIALAKVLAKLVPLWDYRNDCIHCCWRPEGDGVAAIRPKLVDGKLEWRAHRTTAAKMAEVAQALGTIYVALDQLTKLSGLTAEPAAAA